MLSLTSTCLARGLTRAFKVSYSTQRVLFRRQQQQSRGLTLSPIQNAPDERKGGKLYIDVILEDLGDRGLKNEDQIKSENAFKIFNLEAKLLIDEHKLKREMHTLLKVLHPDKYMQVGKETHEKSEQLTSLVVESYQILKNPYRRAMYLLSLKWNKSESEIEHLLDESKVDSEFLTRMMEIREEIDNSRQQSLVKLSIMIESELNDLMRAVNKGFNSKNYESVLDKLARLKFVANCHMAVQEKLGGFGSF